MASSSVCDLRIVLLGKNVSENSEVENLIRGISTLDRDTPLYPQQPSERHISVINTPHLLQPHLTHHQITERVRECVSLSAPGPHVILLVLQYKDFSDEDMRRVKTVLNLFSEKAIKHTIVLTTDEETRTSKWTSMVMDNAIHNLIKECGGGHLQFDVINPGWRSEMIRRIEKILKEEHEEFIIVNMYEDGGDGSSVDPKNLGHKGGGQFYQSTKTGSDGVTTCGKSKLNIVLCGNNTTLKNSVSKIFRGKPIKPQKEMNKECEKREEKIHGRRITVIELPALTRLSEEEVMRETLNCLSLCDPGVHLFILVTPVGSLTNEDKAEMEKIKRLFNSNEHFMVLFTAERPVDRSVSELVLSTESQRVVSLYGSWYSVMGIKDNKNSGFSKILDHIDTMEVEPYSLQMYLRAPEKRVRHELEEKLSVRDKEIKELQEKIKTPEGVKLNLVLCGKESLKSFISNLILNESERGSHLSSEFMRKQVELHGRLISLLELPALFNTQLSEEEVMRQTLRCVSLCDPGVHVFIIIIPDAPLNNEDKAEMEKIQRIFSSRINKHTMILIHQNSEPQTAELNEENQSVVERFGGRHHFIGPNTPVSMLMEKLEQMVETNRGDCFSTETLWDVQIKKLLKFEEMEKRIHSQDSKERGDEVRIVMLGKTGVGKSSTGNTILGRNMFTAESSAESVTKECKRETCQIKGRHVTVIDTPGLFDTEVSNEEIQREITNSISMILPGPHVFLLLISLGRFTQEEANAVKIIQETFGEKSLMYTMVLFTRGDDLDNKSIEQWLGKPGSPLMKLIEVCGNRFHVFNNKQTGDRTQVSDLLKKIDYMVKENGDSYYSCKMFREREREIQEKEKERMKMMMEEERQNYDKEIKKREEQERKMQKEIRREREEWVREKEQERRRRDQEDEKRREKEQAMWDTYNKRLEQEIQRRLRDRDDLQLKYEEEKGKMMEEFRERDKLYKRDIKDMEDQERKIREEMKREREEWERQKQEERQREEEKETQRSNELHTETPEGQLTNNDEDSPPDQECLRILLFGRRGNGKSATGNTILGIDEFHSEDGSNPVTTLCQKGVGEVDGKSVTVVDTPGLFDTTLANEQVVEQIVKCVSLSAPGPHVFIIVLSLGRITQEERDTLDMIKMIFGPKAAEFSIVLFTRGDDLKKQTIEQYVEKSKNAELKKLISDCGNRFLAFNNRETQDRTQVTQLLNMIEELKDSNEGRFFTNETFEAAISNEKRREMIEENKRKNQAQVKELEDRYDMEMKRMIERLKEKKQKTDEERVKLENKFRGKQETLMREFEKKEKSEQKKREKEDQKRSEEEKQRRDEYNQRLEEMKRETENQRLQDEKQQKEREEEDRKREEKYRQDEEKMKTEQEHMMAELRGKQEEEIKKRDLEEQMRKKQEEKEREEWKRKITETEDDKEIQEDMKRQQREWEEEKKRQMKEREEEEREIKERHEEQMREKQEELEKMRERFETDREEQEQMIEEEREKQEREREDKENEMNRRYEELKRERKEWERRKQEDEERRVEKKKRWKKMIEDLKQEQEEEIKRREREERETIEREEKECDEMKQKYKDEIEKMKKKHQDEARKQEEELNDFEERKKKHIEEFKGRLEEELNKVKKLREELKEKWSCRVM